MEQVGESIHAVLNDIHRKISSIKDGELKLWKFIERCEFRNALDVSIVTPLYCHNPNSTTTQHNKSWIYHENDFTPPPPTTRHHPPPPQTQRQQYLSCSCPDCNQTLIEGFWDTKNNDKSNNIIIIDNNHNNHNKTKTTTTTNLYLLLLAQFWLNL